MMKNRLSTFLLCLLMVNSVYGQAPEPFGPLPSARQLKWHEMEYYMFVHFNINTFTDLEWGQGSESPGLFNPTAFDAKQWARIAKQAGMKGIIITAKHHDGFCIWPSAYTEHSVKNSPWKNGKGDVLKELQAACAAYGLKMGVYLSPWDRNHKDYGKPEYISYFRNQLKELLTNYGDIFEVWFDGANGGTGYYGGANEKREVDRKTYYDWDNTWDLVRSLQPEANIFSDAGPDIRWVGNEDGMANAENWALLKRDEAWPGWPLYQQLTTGHIDGTHWLPAEADVSIRPGWYYHQAEDNRVKTVNQLLDIYYGTVGRNASFLLNVPVDRRGLIHPADSAALMQLRLQLDKDFSLDKALKKNATASQVRLNQPRFAADKINDGKDETYWATDDFTRTGSVMIDLGEKTKINRFLVKEYIQLGQRVEAFKLDSWNGKEWQNIAEETTIGYKRILRFPVVETSKIRLTIVKAKACPLISTASVYYAPEPVVAKSVVQKIDRSYLEPERKEWKAVQGAFIIDLKKEYKLDELSYIPMKNKKGLISAYAIFVSRDNKKWQKIAEGEFANIKNNPIPQSVSFPAVSARYIKLNAIGIIDNEKNADFEQIKLRKSNP